MNHKQITVPVASVELQAKLHLPTHAFALVIMGRAHEKVKSGARTISSELWKKDIGTLSIDLLTVEEGSMDQKQFNLELLTERLIAVTHWLQDQSLTRKLILGYYGSGLEAATALRSAAGLHHQIKAVVIQEGDLSQSLNILHQINAPTLLITAAGDPATRSMYREALTMIHAEKKLLLSDEEGDNVKAYDDPALTSQAVDWFAHHFKVMAGEE